MGKGPVVRWCQTTWPLLASTRLDARLPRCLQHVMHADDVVGDQLAQEIGVVRRGGKMYQSVHAGHGALDRDGVGEIADDASGAAWRLNAVEVRTLRPREASLPTTARPMRPADPVTNTKPAMNHPAKHCEPPSTRMTWPLTKRPASEARKTTASAISSGRP